MRTFFLSGLVTAALVLGGTATAFAAPAYSGIAEASQSARQASGQVTLAHGVRPQVYNYHRGPVQPRRTFDPKAAYTDNCLRRKKVEDRWLAYRSQACVDARRELMKDSRGHDTRRDDHRWHVPHKSDDHKHKPHKYGHDKHDKNKVQHRHGHVKPAVPVTRQCLRKRWTPRGWVTYTSQSCLRNHR